MYKILIVLLLSSCSAMDLLPSSKPSIEVDTEITAGDKHEEIASGAVVGTKETTHNTADTLTQSYDVVYNADVIHTGKTFWDTFQLMLMSFGIGWLAMPSTRQMWIMIENLIKKLTNRGQ